MTALSFVVPGKAQPAGSKRAFPYRKVDGGLGVRVSDDNPRARSWKGDVIVYARQAMLEQGWTMQDGPLELHVIFTRVRPASHRKRDGALSSEGLRHAHPTTKPDCTKLLRGLEDAMTEAGVWTDDARVVLQVVEKAWGALEVTTVHVRGRSAQPG